MKHLIATFFLCCSALVFAQQSSQAQGGNVSFNPDKTPCLTTEDYARYREIILENQTSLTLQGKRLSAQGNPQITSFVWPVEQATGFDYNSFWAISNYVDHNPSTNQLEDWNCGTRTYDTSSGYDHQGLDIYTWPFWWKQMDDEQSNVIAAAAGQIVFKNDGSFDRNCSFNNDQWNAIYVEHSDGSVAWYGHMKDGSLTSKNVGDTVAQGEYLGVIGSSGNSTGPHLHFEVYDENNNLIDPYAGPCNDLNDTSWWANQLDYVNPKINTLLTHSAPPEFPACPTTEVPNIAESFDVNDTVIFASYFRDQQAGTSANYAVYDGNGDLYTSWTFDFTDDFYSSYWYWTFAVDATEGEWSFECTYNGETVTRSFQVGALSVDDQTLINLEIFPNPTTSKLHFKSAVPIENSTLFDVSGRKVATKANIKDISGTIDISSLPSGVYFLKVTSLVENAEATLRVVKQ